MPPDITERIGELLGSGGAAAVLATVLAAGDDEGVLTPGVSMEDDIDEASGDSEDVFNARQLASLQTYTNSMPYGCEVPEDMETKLAHIVDMIYICTKANHTMYLKGWDSVLSS